MLKQENYKVREWEGDSILLKYQNFNFDTYNAIKKGSIKEKTTYINSVEYYCDPGEY